jgi:primosomal replication protein N
VELFNRATNGGTKPSGSSRFYLASGTKILKTGFLNERKASNTKKTIHIARSNMAFLDTQVSLIRNI